MDLNNILSGLGNFIKNISFYALISSIIGVIFSSYVSYRFFRRREMIKIRKDIEIKAMEEISNEIYNVINSLSQLILEVKSRKLWICEYNNEPTKENLNLFFPHTQNFEDMKSIGIDKLWKDFESALAIFRNKFDVRSLIFRKFVNKVECLYEEVNLLQDIEAKIFTFMLIHLTILNEGDVVNDEALSIFDQFTQKSLEIINSFFIILAEMQNEFLGDIFKYKTPVKSLQNNSNLKSLDI
jgi:hypothetical protein